MRFEMTAEFLMNKAVQLHRDTGQKERQKDLESLAVENQHMKELDQKTKIRTKLARQGSFIVQRYQRKREMLDVMT